MQAFQFSPLNLDFPIQIDSLGNLGIVSSGEPICQTALLTVNRNSEIKYSDVTCYFSGTEMYLFIQYVNAEYVL